VLCKTIINIFIDWSTTGMSYLQIIPTSKVNIHKLENFTVAKTQVWQCCAGLYNKYVYLLRYMNKSCILKNFDDCVTEHKGCLHYAVCNGHECSHPRRDGLPMCVHKLQMVDTPDQKPQLVRDCCTEQRTNFSCTGLQTTITRTLSAAMNYRDR
jgi:hypothetical protein